MRLGWLLILLLMAPRAFAASHSLTAVLSDAQEAAAVRIAVEQCQRGLHVTGLTMGPDGTCTGTPNAPGLNQALTTALLQTLNGNIADFALEKGGELADAYPTMDATDQAAVDAALKKAKAKGKQ
jgi:hypothetical protein